MMRPGDKLFETIEGITYANDIEDYRDGFSITASDILEYLFCPRFIYFENYLKELGTLLKK